MQKILVCFDGSEWSKKALNEAIKLAQKFGSQITVISVVPKVCFLEIGVDCATVEGIFKAEFEGNLKKAQEILNEKGVKGETIILEGSPADVIVDYAKNGYDLIVIGSKGKDATERTLFGSVTQKVAANATQSVLIIR
ncbi:universal stress protein [Thermodesulfovibrio yellowstonii]|jgi:nucleotide-binding universal stress UspA family protein|uniref:Universal stress protein family n=2 Tax=Thermodesulfovibrio yellowstonii TaxID=28262 RepID=B5YL40_THEYD|nr:MULTISPECIES: universal stress protein [Thermodesulfovibrio]ACI21438.1 universal stress protein family [Thermodesulfovibrio yellowstonii DSM 11347]MBC7189532.1 universal stress protein [Candidatus Aerophobetes bacterium]MDI6864106.1 universal stress protein [Thermodesulfovibrio yellowstonii]GLI53677.1 universal stress protein family [Thermodesulfovibrio islandicus]